MSGLDQKGTKFPSGINVNAGELWIDDVAVTPSAAEMNVLDGVTAGTAAASKVAVLGANKNLDEFHTAALYLGASAGTQVTATATEINKLASVTAGTAAASKAAVLGADKNLDELHLAALYLGAAAGTQVTATAPQLNAAAAAQTVTTPVTTAAIPSAGIVSHTPTLAAVQTFTLAAPASTALGVPFTIAVNYPDTTASMVVNSPNTSTTFDGTNRVATFGPVTSGTTLGVLQMVPISTTRYQVIYKDTSVVFS